MSKRTWIFLLLLVSSMASCWLLVGAQTTEQFGQSPVVTKAVAPTDYPAIAVAAHASGKVVIEVTILANGKVGSARRVEGHSLLAGTAQAAAKRWQFTPASEGSAERMAKLVFNFEIVSRKEDEQTSFATPYEVTYAVWPQLINSHSPSKKWANQ
jgi:TonB family protein